MSSLTHYRNNIGKGIRTLKQLLAEEMNYVYTSMMRSLSTGIA